MAALQHLFPPPAGIPAALGAAPAVIPAALGAPPAGIPAALGAAPAGGQMGGLPHPIPVPRLPHGQGLLGAAPPGTPLPVPGYEASLASDVVHHRHEDLPLDPEDPFAIPEVRLPYASDDPTIMSILSAHRAEQALLFPQLSNQSTSSIMGPEFCEEKSEVDTSRLARISTEQSKMNTPEKRRMIRVFMELQFLVQDLSKSLSRGLFMRDFDHIATLVNSELDPPQYEFVWAKHQLAVKAFLVRVRQKLVDEIGTLWAINDPTIKHGFAATARHQYNQDMERLIPSRIKDGVRQADNTLEKAKASQGKKRGGGSGRGGRGGSKAKRGRHQPDSGRKPMFPKCAACNKMGHVAGDQKCKAGPAPP